VTRILLVEDDDDNLKLFTLILKNEGFVVDAYIDPDNAWAEFRPNSYDLLILDYRMPHLNGLELYKRIIALDKSVVAILLTANYEMIDKTEIEALQGNANLKVIKKPIAIPKLLDEVASILD
jgi:DNA-binding response OmpR family regulator